MPASTAGTKKKTAKAGSHCKRKGCKRKAKTRGLCASDYQLLQYHVKKGHTTWKEAEKSGACLPASRSTKPFNETFPMLKRKK